MISQSAHVYPRVGGRLANFYSVWSDLISDSWVLQAVTGNKIEFIYEPFQMRVPHAVRFSAEETEFIELEVQKMLSKGAIRQVSPHFRQFGSNHFVVPKETGDVRPVINLKPLNEFVQYHHFKMEGLSSLLNLLSRGEFLSTINLKDAYLTIPIHPDHYTFLRFTWKSNLYEFVCLPFGLSSAPRVIPNP